MAVFDFYSAQWPDFICISEQYKYVMTMIMMMMTLMMLKECQYTKCQFWLASLAYPVSLTT